VVSGALLVGLRIDERLSVTIFADPRNINISTC